MRRTDAETNFGSLVVFFFLLKLLHEALPAVGYQTEGEWWWGWSPWPRS